MPAYGLCADGRARYKGPDGDRIYFRTNETRAKSVFGSAECEGFSKSKVKSEISLRQVHPLLSLLDDRKNSIRHLSRSKGSIITFGHIAWRQATPSYEPQGLGTNAG
jgi:hypothetical protein